MLLLLLFGILSCVIAAFPRVFRRDSSCPADLATTRGWPRRQKSIHHNDQQYKIWTPSSFPNLTAAVVSIFFKRNFFSTSPDLLGHPTQDYRVVPAPTMHRPTAVALLQCMAIFACQLKSSSSEVPRSRRSIIGVPMFVCDRFGHDRRESVVGYDGQFRQMFEEAADDDDNCCGAYNYSPRRSTAQLQPTEPEKPRNIYLLTTRLSWTIVIIILLNKW